MIRQVTCSARFPLLSFLFLSCAWISSCVKYSSAGKVFNTHVIISGTGDILAAYRKIHLFDVVRQPIRFVGDAATPRLGLHGTGTVNSLDWSES